MNQHSAVNIALIEHDNNGDDLCVWTYPGMPPILQSLCLKRVSQEGRETPFIFFKVQNDWIYCLTSSARKEILPDVVTVSICLASRNYNPEKFSFLAKILMEQYLSTGDPTKILEAYLSVHTIGQFENKAGKFDAKAFKDSDSYLAVSCLKELSDMLGVEFIVLWNAVLLKKRILVVSENTEKLLSVVRSLPQLAWHRQDFSMLRPIVGSEPEHLQDLNTSGVFTAGTLDASLASKSELYDVLLSLPERRVTVTNHALAEMKMCQIHRELATLCQEEASESTTDLELLRMIAKKTSAVLTQLKGLAPAAGKLTEAAIAARISNEAAQQWLVRLATAESLL